jgi:isoleucyl-tRNA synthetase
VSFRQQAHDYALKYVDLQREQFKRLGVFGEWEHPYLTLSPSYEYWILMSLADLNKKGYLYRGLKPVNWCASCETALAEAEVEYENHVSPSVYVQFHVENPEVFKKDIGAKDLSLLIWTTTPWTLLANVAVSIHPNYTYSFVDIGQQVLILEETLSQKVLSKAGINDFKILKKCRGAELTSLVYRHPFDLRQHCPVVSVDYVTREDGTGLVHTAPGHGQEDFETGLKFKLDVVVPVDHRGVFTHEAGAFAGQRVFEANEKIILALKDKGVLFCAENLEHSYPHCWRCKKPVIFRATKQWFVNIDHRSLRPALLETIESKVRWIPEAGQERIAGMVKTRPDWCLSRQRYWGVPIPALICHGCGGEQKLFTEVIEHFAQMVKQEGTDAWFKHEILKLIPEGFVCPDCKTRDFEKAEDILDVWFDSGVSHQAVVKGMMGKDIPIDLYLEGSDQHRGWFQSSLIPAVAMEGKPPFSAVLTHGFVVDGQGRKMSKSLGNVISPQDIIKNYGADFLRLWVAASNYSDDIRISKEILDRLVDAYRKIRNTFRFMLSNVSDFDPTQDTVAYDKLSPIDQWVLHELAQIKALVEGHYQDYHFLEVYKTLYAFCNETLSGIYLDILKDRLYTSAPKSIERLSAQTVLCNLLDTMVRLTAPILMFTSQEIFALMPKIRETQSVSNVHLLEWQVTPEAWNNQILAEKYQWLLVAFRPHVLKALEEKRQAGMIGSSLEAKVVIETASDQDFNRFMAFDEKVLRTAFIVSQVMLQKVSSVDAGVSTDFSKTKILIVKADGEKCPRCWNYSSLIGAQAAHPELCERCAKVVADIHANK